LDAAAVAARERLLDGRRALSLLMRLLLGVPQDVVRFLFRFEEGFFLAGLRVALGVLDDPQRLFLGPSDGFGGDAAAVRDPDGEHRGSDHRGDDGRHDHVAQYRRHARRPFWTRVNEAGC